MKTQGRVNARAVKRFVKELLALVFVVAVAVGLMFAFTVNAERKPQYKQFQGRVVALPVNVSSPVYGQITSLAVTDGDTVHTGETLATVQMLDPQHANVPNDSALYSTDGDQTIKIKSPVDGTVGAVSNAQSSTIAVANTLATIYTSSSLQVRVLLPRGTKPSQYTAYYATDHVGGARYKIALGTPVPATSPDPALSTDTVYAARFANAKDARALLPYHTVVILAQRPRQASRHLALPSIQLPHISFPWQQHGSTRK